MSFKFEAEPKVVLNRAKYRTNETSGGPNSQEYGSSYATVMKDARVKVLNPSQQEEEFVRLEKERIKHENMQKQLVSFKQSKKMSPYNIKPSPQPKVSANLTFFLTDATDVKPPQTNVEIQADIFKERPKTPQYVPKKTGRDVSTQIEDNELFNFDREVTPIISVICTKTIEQSMIEIEEEEELNRIKKFKEEYWKRREEDEQKWKGMLQKELDAISTKEKKLEEYRLKEDKRVKVLRKLQSYQVARTYLRDLQFNSISYLHKNGLYVNEEREELVNKVPSFFVEGVIKTLGQRQTVRSDFAEAFNNIEGELLARREIADKQFKKRQEKKRIQRINNSKTERLVRFIYLDDSTPSSYFAKFVSKMQEQDLPAFFNDYRSRLAQLKDRFKNGEISKEDFISAQASEFPETQTPSNLRFSLQDFNKLSFNVANNMYYSELHRDGFLDISVSAFDRDGAFLYQVDKENVRNDSKSIRYTGGIRDTQVKVSDDLGMKINLGKIEGAVSHLVLTVEIKNLDQTIGIYNDFLQHSRFRLADYASNQTIEENHIHKNFRLEELKDSSAESELGGKILCYYLYRTGEPEPGWFIESIGAFKNVAVDAAGEFNEKIARFLQNCTEEEYKGFGETVDYTKSAQESIDSKEPKKSARGESDKDQKSKNISTNKTLSEKEKSTIDKGTIKNAIDIKPEDTAEEEANFGISFTSRTFGPLALKADDELEAIQRKVDEAMEAAAPLLHQSFEYGYEITVADHEMIRPTQIKKIGALTSFVLKRKPKPIEVPVTERPEGEEGEQAEQDERKSAEEDEE